MGLDKWLKPEEAEKEPKSKTPSEIKEKKAKDNENLTKIPEKPKIKLKKFRLTCSNSKCKYQKIIMKKQLEELDKVCPRCKKEMKIS
ncbi:MAG: hypothetical protein ACFFDB_13135 [Promethearchaeota archaeon]